MDKKYEKLRFKQTNLIVITKIIPGLRNKKENIKGRRSEAESWRRLDILKQIQLLSISDLKRVKICFESE